MVDFEYKDSYGFEDLYQVVNILRHPGGCPWDAEQTHASIRRNFIEETYEACEAIDQDDPILLREELGDVLLQVLFHASIETDAGRFTLDDVCDQEVKKLVFRHPHVFGARQVSGSEEVLVNWEELKREEKGQTTFTDTLQAVARTLPALWRAEKVQKKAAKAGMQPPEAAGLIRAQAEAAANATADQAAQALGDLMFCAVAMARSLEADPEDLLTAATDRFIQRFSQLEAQNAPETNNWAGLWPADPTV